MKNWQIISLCLSIFLSMAASAFYLKYEPKNRLETNYGLVNLGSVFSEMVMIDVSLKGLNGDKESWENLVKAGSYYDKEKPLDDGFIDIFDSVNTFRTKEEKISYDDATPIDDEKLKLKITTYINYHSSNFQNTPYTLGIREKTYSLSKDMPIKEQVRKIVNDNIENTKADISEYLFITDKDVIYNLIK